MAYKAPLWNALQCSAEAQHIASVNPIAPGSDFNHDPACFARYCNMQANHMVASGYPLLADEVTQARDIANPHFRSECRAAGGYVMCQFAAESAEAWHDIETAGNMRRFPHLF